MCSEFFEEDKRHGGDHVRSFVDRRDKGKEEMWRLEPEGAAEKPGATGQWSEVQGVSVDPEVEKPPQTCTGENGKEGKRESNNNGKEGK